METKRNLGFTLVELLVVIAIIGILSTVAIVNLNSSRQKAKETAALQSVSSYTTAAIMCDNDDSTIVNPITPPNIYIGGQFCTDDIGINWPDVGKLPEGYDAIFASDPVGGEWHYFLVDFEADLTAVVCENVPNRSDGKPNGCRIGF
ncbi:type II secretion system protein [Candidatus Parcubacteria bacterium]|nr:MAG: type II secretion system protein [Candidatus Parcubacteria bacterium]